MGKRLLFFLLLTAYSLGAAQLYAQAADDNSSLASRGTTKQRDQAVAREIRRSTSFYVGEFYPNPAQGKVEIVYNLPSDGKLTIYNLLGSPVQNRQLDKDGRLAELDVAALNEGVYFCTFFVGSEKIATRRMVVKR